MSSDLAQANMKAMKESQTTNRPILRKASSLAAPNFVDEIRWMKLRRIDLSTADGLPPLPMQISWVRDGILVVGMDSEMHVYSQWKSSCGYHGLTLGPRKRNSGVPGPLLNEVHNYSCCRLKAPFRVNTPRVRGDTGH